MFQNTNCVRISRVFQRATFQMLSFFVLAPTVLPANHQIRPQAIWKLNSWMPFLFLGKWKGKPPSYDRDFILLAQLSSENPFDWWHWLFETRTPQNQWCQLYFSANGVQVWSWLTPIKPEYNHLSNAGLSEFRVCRYAIHLPIAISIGKVIINEIWRVV